jgi:hypothetical protein
VYDQRLYDSRRPPAAGLIFTFQDLPGMTHFEVFGAAPRHSGRGCKLTYIVEEIPNAPVAGNALSSHGLGVFGRAVLWHEACSKSERVGFFTDDPLISTVPRARSAGQG